MTTTRNSISEVTLYVCRDCGDGIEDPTDTSTCPHCGGQLVNSTVPHD
ncbi:rubrerythrin-like domain-containing protein [Halogranum rubrum]|nr:rubrerythrin-like domain-containing protein [Halogranum salarium]